MQWPIPPWPTKSVVGNQTSLFLPGTPHTKGNWASPLTLGDQSAAWINFSLGRHPSTTGDRSLLIDLAITTGGSETIVAPNLLLGYHAPRSILLPLHIPAGATLRMRGQSGGASFSIPCRVTAYLGEPDSGLTTPGKITAYGVNTGTTAGASAVPSGASKGNWVQLTAATTAPIHALMVLAQASSISGSDTTFLADIGVGASGSETVIVPNTLWRQYDPYIYPMSPHFLPLSMSIPAGTRLAARCAMDFSGSLPLHVAAYGITY